jgi:hypothetical protein
MYQCTTDNSGPVLLRHRTNWAKSGTGLWIETPLYPPPAQPAPVQEPVHQWREKHSAYWYDGYPDNDDGGGPYETRTLYATPPAAPVQEPVEVDQATMELAESVGLIGPASRTHGLHASIQRFHDLICVNATIKAAKMAADAIRESTPPAAQQEPFCFFYVENGEEYFAPKGAYVPDNAQPLYTTPTAAQQVPLEYWNAVEGWVKIDEVREHFDSVGCGTIYKTAGDGRVPLTAAQRQWVGLTDDEILKLAYPIRWQEVDDFEADKAVNFAQAIEAELKEKNT